MKLNGKIWVGILAAFGAAGGTVAVTHWQRPENSVRWAFTQLHTSLLRKRMEAPRQLTADVVVVDGRPQPRDVFLAAYLPPTQPGELDVRPCAADGAHWTVAMAGRTYCFQPAGRAWQLHWIGSGPCGCRSAPADR